MEQVPIVAICKRGHLQDFPWREWVHSEPSPLCSKKLKLTKSGGFGLSAQKIKCECGKERSLQGVLGGSEDGDSNLSSRLGRSKDDTGIRSDDVKYLCQGRKPWLGSFGLGEPCPEQLRASLRSSGNVYFPDIASSLHLPDQQDVKRVFGELVELLNQVGPSSVAELAAAIGADPVEALRTKYSAELSGIKDLDIQRALAFARSLKENDPSAYWKQSLRGKEYGTLSTGTAYPDANTRDATDKPLFLMIDPVSPERYGSALAQRFSRVNLVPKLRENRVLAGFSRVSSESPLTRDEKKQQLWAKTPQDWLPAYVVLGEGFFIQFDTNTVREWKEHNKDRIAKRLLVLGSRSGATSKNTAEFIMMHTFSHLLMNRLVYECGYQSASLRERLFCSPDGDELGVLIYTAAGDADGTLGGLVRMGREDRLPLVIQRALEGALWCSSDPVCRDIGGTHGQGPDSCNLAACHSCAMVPETACETFNKYLDRGLVIGTPQNPELGFFPSSVL